MQDNGDSQDTRKAQRNGTRGRNPNSLKNLVAHKFKKGADPRRNVSGRPKTFEQFRAIAQSIAAKEIVDKNGNTLTVGEAILRTWAKSKEPQLQRAFIEYAFGKVPDKFEAPLEPKTILTLYYGHEREKRDEEHKRLSSGLSSGAEPNS